MTSFCFRKLSPDHHSTVNIFWFPLNIGLSVIRLRF